MTELKPCKQEKCSFKKGSPFEHMCPRCAECGAPPHLIDNKCVECCCCESDEGKIRDGKPDRQLADNKIPQEKQILEVIKW